MKANTFTPVSMPDMSDESNANFRYICVDNMAPDPNQPRKNKPLEYIESLALSIATDGLGNMIHVFKSEEAAVDYLIQNGECRWTACSLVLKKHMPAGDWDAGHVRCRNGRIEIYCEIKTFKSEVDRKANQILDNASRKMFDPLEELMAISQLITDGMAVGDVANALGRSASVIEADLPILNMPDPLLKVYDRGEMVKAVAREIATFPNQKQMTNAWTNYASKVRGTKAQLARLEVYRKAVAREKTSLLGDDINEADTEAKKAARITYRKLKVAVEKAVESDLIPDENFLMVKMNSRHLDEVDELAKSLAKIARNLADGVILAKNQN